MSEMKKKKVLVIEDISQMFILYKYCLDNYFEVVHGKSFTDIQNLSDKDEVVVTILDYHMPGESFDNILDYIDENYINTKKVLISGHADSLGLEQKYGDRLDEVFSKPLDDYTKLADYLVELVGLEKVAEDSSSVNNDAELDKIQIDDTRKKVLTEEDIKADLLNRESNLDKS